MKKINRMQSGFTFLEVMAVVAISGSLAALSLPMIQTAKIEKTATAIQSGFARALTAAREIAVASGEKVSVCASSDGVNCSSNWSAGVLVFQGASRSNIAEENVVAHIGFSEEIKVTVFNENPEQVEMFQFGRAGNTLQANRFTATFCAGEVFSTLTLERTGRVLSGEIKQEYQDQFLNEVTERGHSEQELCHQV